MDREQRYINEICEILQIEIPNISTESSKFLSETMMALYIPGEDILYIKQSEFTPDSAFAIAHELRHIWQWKNNRTHYFDDYKDRNELSVEEYNMQIAEIDANAFGTIVMADCFHLKPMFNGLSDEVIAAINKQIDIIAKDL